MDGIDKSIEILKQGGIVIFPTDTVYGIGCRIDSNEAINRLFKLRRRPATQAVPVLVDSIRMAQNYLNYPISDNVRHLMDKYWPGALTIVYPCNIKNVPNLVRGGGKTIGVRQPKHNTVIALITGIGVPLLGPSANFHGEATPFRFEDIDKELIKVVDYIIYGDCLLKEVSTVIECSKKSFKIIRLGAVKIDKTDIF